MFPPDGNLLKGWSDQNLTSIESTSSWVSATDPAFYHSCLLWVRVAREYRTSTWTNLKWLIRSELFTYANFKKSFGMENYLLCMKTKNKRRHFTKLRISAHHLPIEKGRYSRPVTPRDQRFCQSCDMMSIGDEFHFLLVCPKHDEQRLILFDQLSKFTILSNEQDQDTFIHLMSCCQGDTEVSNLVCRFVENCLTDV